MYKIYKNVLLLLFVMTGVMMQGQATPVGGGSSVDWTNVGPGDTFEVIPPNNGEPKDPSTGLGTTFKVNAVAINATNYNSMKFRLEATSSSGYTNADILYDISPAYGNYSSNGSIRFNGSKALFQTFDLSFLPLSSGTSYLITFSVDYVGDTSGAKSGNTIAFTTKACGAITGFTPIVNSNKTASLSWGSPSNDGTMSYDVQYKLASSATWSTSFITGSTSYVTPVLAPGKYNWRVNTKCSSGSDSTWAGYGAATPDFTIVGPCGCVSNTPYTAPIINNTAGTNFYCTSITSASAVTLSSAVHVFEATAVILSPGFVTSVSATGGFKAVAFNPTTCATSKTSDSKEEVIATTDTNQPVAQTGKIVIYPNPTTGLLNIQLPLAAEAIKQVQFTNELGQTMLTTHSEATSIDISNFSNGLYFYKIETNKGNYGGKIIKK